MFYFIVCSDTYLLLPSAVDSSKTNSPVVCSRFTAAIQGVPVADGHHCAGGQDTPDQTQACSPERVF